MRNGIRIGDLRDMVYFESRLRGLVKQLEGGSCAIHSLPRTITLYLCLKRTLPSLSHVLLSLTRILLFSEPLSLPHIHAKSILRSFYPSPDLLMSLLTSLILLLSPSSPSITGSYPGFKIDVESELAYYTSIRDEILEMTLDTIQYSNQALKDGKSILIEGANATSTY